MTHADSYIRRTGNEITGKAKYKLRKRSIVVMTRDTKEETRSLTMDGYDINKLSMSLPQTLPAHTQAGKTELKAMGCGQGKESRVLTIHEAQGLASKMW
ncbi:hypothetical protein EVAR_21309_1 [Eumeta japonica]|uniref:(+)RNA virus helicase C-terminal domain-containing protein n=1 Tax=Eumeta variegata TaxID=151549 RepID=A0A4C1WL67_EUMVA|nr:hypothetical protein EVAR_21309_1 [Eumeta japonica]